jgi:hypothetical protein
MRAISAACGCVLPACPRLTLSTTLAAHPDNVAIVVLHDSRNRVVDDWLDDGHAPQHSAAVGGPDGQVRDAHVRAAGQGGRPGALGGFPAGHCCREHEVGGRDVLLEEAQRRPVLVQQPLPLAPLLRGARGGAWKAEH